MSTTIDQRVVEMRFDNKQFESNVATTMSSLDKLNKSLDLKGASKGLEEVNSAAKKVDMSSLGDSVESVRVRFSALQIMGVTALTNITNSAVNAGKRIASALTIDPIKTGLSEYETQIGAIQTILANTESKGTTLDDVNGALDELNTYADKTIYNFTEMTRNIGTFTAAGIDLDKSVSSIKGIANLAAVSGSTSQQASTAMYQLSQAMASGTVKLMDWNSVVNAGMGGQVFQDALKTTAKAHGVAIDDIIKKNGSFRESLQDGWLTADILTETLTHFTMAAEEGSKEWEELKTSLKNDGYTDEQAESILKLANTATGAATEVKTFSQLWDTLKESAQSGWSQTWEIIIGDFEEAKKFLTELSDLFGGIIGASAESRNDMLENWKTLGGRDDLLESFRNLIEGISSIVKPIKEAFDEIFPPMTAEKLVAFTRGLKELTAKLKIGDETADKLKRTFKGVFATFDIVKQVISAVFKAAGSLFGTFGDLGGSVLDLTASFGDWLVNLNESIRSSGIFVKVFQGVADIIKAALKFGMKFVKLLKDGLILPGWEGVQTLLQGIRDRMSGISDAAGGMKDGVVNAFDALGSALEGCTLFKIFEGLWKVIEIITTTIGKLFGAIAKSLGNSFSGNGFEAILDFINALSASAIIVFIAKLSKRLPDLVESFGDAIGSLGGFKDGIIGVLDSVRGCFKAYQDQIKAEALMKIAQAIAILVASLLVLSLIDDEKLSSAIGAITVLFAELLGAMAIIGKIKLGAGMFQFGYVMTSLAASLLILSAAMKVMSTMSLEEMGIGLLGISAGLTAMVIAVNLLPEKKVSSAASAIKKMSTALLILSVAIKIMSTMTWEEMGIGLISMAVGLGALVAAVNLLPKSTALRALGMTSLATAMLILAAALKVMSTMTWEEMAIGLTTLAGSLAILVVAMKLVKNALPGAAAMFIIAPALVVLAGALKIMGSMSLDEIGHGLMALGGAMMILAIGLNVMKHTIAGSAAMLVASAALAILAPVLLLLGSMEWSSIAKGLAALAGAFTVIGVAGLLLAPIVPSIILLGAAIALIGAGVLAAGIGLAAFGVGLTALATGITTLSVSLTSVANAIVEIIKTIFIGIAEGIVAFCEVIADGAPIIGEAVKELVLTICGVLIECVPVITDTSLELIVSLLDSLSKFTPKIVDSLFQFILGLLNGLADHIPEFIQAVFDILMSVFEGAIDALSNIDTDTMIKGLLGIGLMTGIVAALGAIVPLIPAAMVGAVGMGTVVAELAIVLAAIGALAQIPGLEWLVSEGGDFLQKIGTAIGQFIGGIVGGIAQGFTSSLPQIGTDLATFMNNLQPFIEGVQRIDSSIVEGAKSLVGVILAITGASVIEALTSWITGGSSITTFAAELPILGAGLKGFSDSVAGISAENIIAASNAAKALAEMTAIIPNEGGIVSWFAGENSIAKFGHELPILGAGLKGFSDAVTGIVPENVVAAATAAKALAEMTAIIPNEGGVVSWFTGENSISKFASDIVTLGYGLKGFSDSVAGISAENIIAASNAAKALADMTSAIPNEGGIVSWFTGESSISKFAGELPKLGAGLKGFSDATAGIAPETVVAAATAAKSLADMASVIPAEGGIVAWFTGESSISKFGGELTALGHGLKGFSDATAGIAPETITAAATAAKSLADMASVIPSEGGIAAWFSGESSIASFSGKLPGLGDGLKGFSDAVEGISPEHVTAAANAAKSLAEMASVIPAEGGIAAWFGGEKSIATFAGKLPKLGEGLKGFSDSVEGISPENVTAAANAAKSLGDMTGTIPEDTSKVVSFGDNLKKFGTSLKSYFAETAGITADSVSGVKTTIDVVERVAKVNSSGIQSAADAIKALVNAIKGMSGVAKDAASGVSDAMNDIAKVSVDSLKKIAPDMKAAGENAIKSFANGIKASNEPKVACKDLASACVEAIKGTYDSFKSAGKYAAQGFADGIDANAFAAKAKAKAMANAALRAAEEALDEESPSKEFYRIGAYGGEGFVNALDAYGDVSYSAGSEMADSARVGLQDAISRISDAINGDMDLQPTIRPVLDLSDVRAGAGRIGDLFGTGNVGVLANVNAISSMMNRRGQNGGNHDVVSAIDKLNKKLDNVGNTYYNIDGVTYDDGSNITDAVKTIVRAAKIERRT